MNLAHQRINNCYDSHVHWLATGVNTTRLQLNQFKSEQDILSLKVNDFNFQGSWLIGFGWDQNRWSSPQFPHRKTLDQRWTDIPVALSRADGHALWVNTAALKQCDLLTADFRLRDSIPADLAAQVVLDHQGVATGVLIDSAMLSVQKLIPKFNSSQVRELLLLGQKKFNSAGFTHIRDMTCDDIQWNESVHLYENHQLTLAVEQYFNGIPENIEQTVNRALKAKAHAPPFLRVQGVKVFYDGALGSEGALISKPYASGSGCGLELMSTQQLEECLRLSWDNKLDIAVHAIGDEAADRVVNTANKLWDQGVSGRLHIEHSQMLRPETINKLMHKNVICHFQPCHWLSDRLWLRKKLGDLFGFVFPWRALEDKNINFFFGSDSPIEPAGVEKNLLALSDSSQQGVPALINSPLKYHTHPDHNWVPKSYTLWGADGVSEVWFSGQSIC